MARTYRNRHTVPHGFVVRDGGRVYYKNGYPSLTAERQEYEKFMREAREEGLSWFDRYRIWQMEHDPDPPEFRSNFLNKERKDVRKAHFRQYRAKIKNLIRQERFDDIWPYRKTSGWLTW